MIELPVIDPTDEPGGDRTLDGRNAASPNGSDHESRVRFWRSINQYEGTEEFKRVSAEEFLPGASDSPGGASRRQFLQIMGASMALAGLTACRRPVENILPFARKPEDMIPGVANEYASGMPFRGSLRPILVENTDGRPTKIEGNPEHVDSRGASTVFEQAALLGVYDPDRSRVVRHEGEEASWDDFKGLVSSLPGTTRVAVLAEASSSMTQAALRRELGTRFASLRWVTYNMVDGNNRARGYRDAYFRPWRPRYRFSNARVIVSLDADFLSTTGVDSLNDAREFAESRAIEENGTMSRLYAVESGYSITGAMADNRLRLKSGDIAAFTTALSEELGVTSGHSGSFSGHTWISELARDLRSAGPNAVVLAGDAQPPVVHALCAAINDALGATGTTVELLDVQDDASDTLAEFERLTADMSDGRVDLLLMLGVNPVYDSGVESDFVAALAKVPESVHLGLHVDETAKAAKWHLPQAHFLEAWGDGRSYSGVMGVIQPLIAPLYQDAHSDLEVLGLLASGNERFGYDMVRSTWRLQVNGSFEQGWRKAVHDGFLAGSGFATVHATANRSAVQEALNGAGPMMSGEGIELVLNPCGKLFDGRFSNNAWLQELPESTTKVVWDNVALMSPATADSLGLSSRLTKGKYYGDTVAITAGGATVDLPVWMQPGMADGSIHLALGYGRDIRSDRPERDTNLFDLDDYTDVYGHGAVSTGVGGNVSPLRGGGGRILPASFVEKSGSDYLVASTQDHGALEEDGFEVERRGLFRMATVDEYRADPDFVRDGDPEPIREAWADYPTLWEERHPTGEDAFKDSPYNVNQWGMVIDLNTCTGCNACVVACQAENNIQVVGKDEVSRGREMHWIRMDRYFVSGDSTDVKEPRMVLQPVPCMHCENAPCEEVCPVAATVHSPDGTNQMIYNRCIGTRYCANNCPYKVRRFNFFNWTKTLPTTVRMAQNPNVTVRSRGVMEKCSYCIQRVREADRKANLEHRSIQEGEVRTACQQACPSSAITFGDLANPDSKVNAKRASNRRYEMLAELNVKPRTSYLGRIRNPNPNLTPRV